MACTTLEPSLTAASRSQASHTYLHSQKGGEMWVCSKEHPKYTSGEGMVGVDVAKQAPQVPLRPHSEGRWTGSGRGSSELPAAAHPGCPWGEHVALAARLPHPSNQEFLSGALEVYVHTSTVFSSITSPKFLSSKHIFLYPREHLLQVLHARPVTCLPGFRTLPGTTKMEY